MSENLTFTGDVSPTDRGKLPIIIFPRCIFLAHKNTAFSLVEQKQFWAKLRAGNEGLQSLSKGHYEVEYV